MELRGLWGVDLLMSDERQRIERVLQDKLEESGHKAKKRKRLPKQPPFFLPNLPRVIVFQRRIVQTVLIISIIFAFFIVLQRSEICQLIILGIH